MLMLLCRCRFLTLHRCGAGHETGCRHTILCPALHSLDSYALQFQPIVALLTACSWHGVEVLGGNKVTNCTYIFSPEGKKDAASRTKLLW